MKAFNLRGTNGTGKTHVARKLMEVSGAKPYGPWQTKTKPMLYRGYYNFMPLYFIGSYETNCGGCDTIPKVAIVAEELNKLMSRKKYEGVVFYEGLMISHMIGTVGAMAKKYNEHHVMGFLNTSLKVCILRVERRRKERGDDRPFDPERTLIKDYKAVQAARVNAIAQDFNVVDIDWRSAYEDVLAHVVYLTDHNNKPLASMRPTTPSKRISG